MKPVPDQSLDDILFENRNKEYGSYLLRKRYLGRLFLSFGISVITLFLLILGYFLYINTDRDDVVYIYSSSNPYLKSTEGSLLDPEELAAYMSRDGAPEDPVNDLQELEQIDPLHNFKIAENITPDTFVKTYEKEDPVEPGSMGMGTSTDSSVFGGFLLGEGIGSGSSGNLDKFPEFPGGPDAVRRYIEMSVIYPAQAQKQKIHGRVIISFDVNKSGEVDNIKVERSINPLLDAEAVKAVRNMPRWKPGVRHGKPVIVKFVIPVNFMPLS